MRSASTAGSVDTATSTTDDAGAASCRSPPPSPVATSWAFGRPRSSGTTRPDPRRHLFILFDGCALAGSSRRRGIMSRLLTPFGWRSPLPSDPFDAIMAGTIEFSGHPQHSGRTSWVAGVTQPTCSRWNLIDRHRPRPIRRAVPGPSTATIQVTGSPHRSSVGNGLHHRPSVTTTRSKTLMRPPRPATVVGARHQPERWATVYLGGSGRHDVEHPSGWVNCHSRRRSGGCRRIGNEFWWTSHEPGRSAAAAAGGGWWRGSRRRHQRRRDHGRTVTERRVRRAWRRRPIANPTLTGTVTAPGRAVQSGEARQHLDPEVPGRRTASSGPVEEMTAPQAQSLLGDVQALPAATSIGGHLHPPSINRSSAVWFERCPAPLSNAQLRDRARLQVPSDCTIDARVSERRSDRFGKRPLACPSSPGPWAVRWDTSRPC